MEKKVLFTASTYSHIRTFHLPYLQRFQEEGWTVHVACGGTPCELPADEIIPLPLKKRMAAPENFRAAGLLRRKMEQEGYGLITTHTSLAAFFTRLALRGMKSRPPVVNMVHGYLFDSDTNPLKRQVLLAAERMTAPCTDLLLVMNRWDYEEAARRRLGARVETVPGIGVDFDRLSAGKPLTRQEMGLPENAFVLFYAAEFSKRKSQSVLLRALAQLPEDVYLVLAGEGVLWEECRTLARTLGVDHRVKFPGYIQNAGAWYTLADAAVSASRIEGLPFNIMEAMYVGTPVIASAVKGHEDLITHEETGLLYPYGDADACSAEILRLRNNEALRVKLAEQAKAQMPSYGIEEVLPQVMAKYESLLAPVLVEV